MKVLAAIFLLATLAIGTSFYFDGAWTQEQPVADAKTPGTLRAQSRALTDF